VDLVLGKAGVAVPAVERASLRQRREVAKRRLAAEDRAEVQVRDRTIPVSRAEFETATAPITARIRPVVLRCLRDAGVAPAELDDVLLVGGASRMPLVHTLIGSTLERLGNRSLDPDRVVALGAAVQAARCDRSEAVRELMLTDVCAHTLGVEVSNELTPGELKGGDFLPIIERNTTIPISRSVPLETLHPQQDVPPCGSTGRTAGGTRCSGRSRSGPPRQARTDPSRHDRVPLLL
jgi:molecular chaperone HscC